MLRRPEAALVAEPAGESGWSPAAVRSASAHRPDIAGELDGLLSTAPCFRTAVRGYDRYQVDNYVAWAEAEIATARREADDLLGRFGQCSAELEIARRLLARSPEGQELTFVSERVGRMLRMAADEAAEITAAAQAEADEILAEARVDAEARLRKAREIKELAVAASERMRAEAEAEVAELQRRRDEARESLRRLTDQIGEALDALAGTRPEAPANFVVDRAPVPF